MVVHLLISGRVQGVGYRRFLKRKAEDLRLAGWVRNMPDRRVEAYISGGKENVEKLIELAKKGPFLAEVTDVQIASKDEEVSSGHFFIRG